MRPPENPEFPCDDATACSVLIPVCLTGINRAPQSGEFMPGFSSTQDVVLRLIKLCAIRLCNTLSAWQSKNPLL